MLGIACSFISTVVEYQRKRRLKSSLEEFFSDPANRGKMVICRRARQRPTNGNGGNFLEIPGKLTKFSSEPCLAPSSTDVMYSVGRAEVAKAPAEILLPNDWKFCPCITPESSAEALNSIRVFFVAISATSNNGEADNEESCIYINRTCSRAAFCIRTSTEGMYVCRLDEFVEVVYAWSNDCLFEKPHGPKIEQLKTFWLDDPTSVAQNTSASSQLMTSSALSLVTTQQALPLLRQLFFGDKDFGTKLRQRFMSEGALNGNFSLPRNFSPQRLARHGRSSVRTRSPSPLALEYRSSYSARHNGPLSPPFVSSHHSDYGSLPASYRNHSLPPYIRNLENQSTASTTSKTTADSRTSSTETLARSDSGRKTHRRRQTSEHHNSSIPKSEIITSKSCSPSTTFENLASYTEHVIDAKIIEEDIIYIDSDSTLNYSNEMPVRNGKDLSPRSRMTTGSMLSKSIGADPNGPPLTPPSNTRPETPSGFSLGSARSRGHQNSPLLEMVRKMSLTEDPNLDKCIDPQLQRLTTFELLQRRRHSYIPQSIDDDNPGYHSTSSARRVAAITARRCSLSPKPKEKNGTLKSCLASLGSTDMFKSGSLLGEIRDSFRRPIYSPRRMSACRSRDPSVEKPLPKPPTILVFAGDDHSLYSRIRDCLARCVPAEIYTVFHLSVNALKKQPWIEASSACILIANTSFLDDAAWVKLHQYFNQSGKIIFVCQNQLLSNLMAADSSKQQTSILKVDSSEEELHALVSMMAFGERSSALGKDFEAFLKKGLKQIAKNKQVHETFHSKDVSGSCRFSVVLSKKPETPMLLYMENGAQKASAIFSDATTDQLLDASCSVVRDALSRVGIKVLEANDQPPPLTKGYFLAGDPTSLDKLKLRLGEQIGSAPSFFFRKTSKLAESPLPPADQALLPVEVLEATQSLPSFDSQLYFSTLKARRLGAYLLFVPIATTTMDVGSSLSNVIPGVEGLIVIARQQTKGKGRGGNEFISPPGTAMFTFNCEIPRKSRLAERPSLLQHILATAVVETVREMSGLKDFPVYIKWPNDFYFKRCYKLGGLLASAKIRDDSLELMFGVGLNVTNSRPTICLSDLLPENSSVQFRVEELIAKTLTRFEELLAICEMKGFEAFKSRYESVWLHSREEVSLEDGDRVLIKGIDHNGYLQVRSKKTGKVFTIGDDGNTFDVMKGLIRHKIV